MDGFRKDELVFVVGTTNYVESLDPALLRPGRFEFHLQIPFPGSDDRRAILSIYDQKMQLSFTERAMDYAVKRTGDLVEGTHTRYTGDHLQALCRALARVRLREGREASVPTEIEDVERAMSEFVERPALTPREEFVVATHEAGHAVCALFCEHTPAIDRISIRGDLAGSLGFVSYADPAHRYVVTRGQLQDQICTLMGGREAELLLLEDLSIGSAADLDRATEIARALVEQFGMGGDGVGVRVLPTGRDGPGASDSLKEAGERAVSKLLEQQRQRAVEILAKNKALVASLRDLLIEKKVLDREALSGVLPKGAK
jgi:cell division protease FtsH